MILNRRRHLDLAATVRVKIIKLAVHVAGSVTCNCKIREFESFLSPDTPRSTAGLNHYWIHGSIMLSTTDDRTSGIFIVVYGSTEKL